MMTNLPSLRTQFYAENRIVLINAEPDRWGRKQTPGSPLGVLPGTGFEIFIWHREVDTREKGICPAELTIQFIRDGGLSNACDPVGNVTAFKVGDHVTTPISAPCVVRIC
ncbi:hypothetical protein FKM82_024453 [Ascaphus truei]